MGTSFPYSSTSGGSCCLVGRLVHQSLPNNSVLILFVHMIRTSKVVDHSRIVANAQTWFQAMQLQVHAQEKLSQRTQGTQIKQGWHHQNKRRSWHSMAS